MPKPKKSMSAPKATIPTRSLPKRKCTTNEPAAENAKTNEKMADSTQESRRSNGVAAAAATKQPDKEEEDSASDDDTATGDEEEWDLTKIFTIKELNKKKPTMCDRANDGNVNCGLVACSRWESKGQKPWNTCLDCQVK